MSVTDMLADVARGGGAPAATPALLTEGPGVAAAHLAHRRGSVVAGATRRESVRRASLSVAAHVDMTATSAEPGWDLNGIVRPGE